MKVLIEFVCGLVCILVFLKGQEKKFFLNPHIYSGLIRRDPLNKVME